MKKISAMFLVAAAAYAHGQGKGAQVGKPVTLPTKPIVETTASIQLRELLFGPKHPRVPKNTEVEHEIERQNLKQNPAAVATATWPPESAERKRTPSAGGRATGPYFTWPVNIGGPQLSESNSTPPDSNGDASPNSVIIATNGRIKSYTKSGLAGSLNADLDVFFNSVRSDFTSDPRVVYDRLTQRWFVSVIDVKPSNNRICLAVSNTETISAATVWTFYQFSQNIGGGSSTAFADYESLGVDANGVYLGTNVFGTTTFNTDLFCINKANLLAGTLTVTAFHNLLPSSSGTGIYTPWPCTNDDPAATVALVLGVDNAAYSTLSYRRVTYSAGTFTLSANATLTVPTTASPMSITIPGGTSTVQLDTLDDRLFYTHVQKNRVTGETNVLAAHNIRGTSSGVASGSGDRVNSRWYKLGNLFSGALTLTTSGTVYDTATTGFKHCIIPSVAMNGQGNTFVGFSMANNTNCPGIGGAYRIPTDALSSVPTLMVPAGGTSFNISWDTGGAAKRFGDYSFTVVDPSDMQSMWTFQEYVPTNNTWQVRGLKILGPAPTVTSFVPASATQGQTLTVSVNGTGIFDPDATYPNHLALNFGANVTVNSVSWISPTQANVNITVGSTATTGARTVTLTNPDGQTATNSFTVNSGLKTYSGTINSSGINVSTESYKFTFKDSTTGTTLDTVNASPDSSGNFSIQSNVTGNFKLSVKTRKRLSDSTLVTGTATGATGIVVKSLPGDANNDDVVNLVDFSAMSTYYGLSSSASNWNTVDGSGVAPSYCDWNNDGTISLLDFSLLSSNYGAAGNP